MSLERLRMNISSLSLTTSSDKFGIEEDEELASAFFCLTMGRGLGRDIVLGK